jgi:hypothetical protein
MAVLNSSGASYLFFEFLWCDTSVKLELPIRGKFFR